MKARRQSWEERLETPEFVSPPEELLLRLVDDIPEASELRSSAPAQTDIGPAEPRSASPRTRWLAAASVVLTLAPAFWLWRAHQPPGDQPVEFAQRDPGLGPMEVQMVEGAPDHQPPPQPPDQEPSPFPELRAQYTGELSGLEAELSGPPPHLSNGERGADVVPEPMQLQPSPSRPMGERYREEVTVADRAPQVDERHLQAAQESRYSGRYAADYGLSPPPPDTMIFQGEVPHRFVDPAEEPLSTFGLDVDTGSFTLARRYLLDVGRLPPADSIRIEEWVNYFDYGDAAPSRGDFRLVVEGAPSLSGSSRRSLVRIGVRARDVRQSQRRPATLIFLVDVSGSMGRENRLELVKRSLELLIDELEEDDRVGLVVYSNQAREILEPTSNRARILRALSRLQPEESTNLAAGMTLAYEMAARHVRRGALSRVVLCSDGVANVGEIRPRELLGSIADSAQAGIELSTVGFGMGNYNDALMEQLANRGDGSYAYVDTLEEAKRVFVENLSGMLHTVAFDARVQVEFDPEVVARYRQLGYENRELPSQAFRDPETDAGEIGAGHEISVLYEIERARGASTNRDLAVLRLRYRSKETGEFEEIETPIRQRDFARNWQRAESGLRLASTVASVADALRDIDQSEPRLLTTRELDLLATDLERAKRELGRLEGLGDKKVEEFRQMVEQAYRMVRVAQD